MLASVKSLLASVVDYAGLFPPAKLELREAMENYVQDLASPYAWMLGHFVLPAFRLPEFKELLPAFPLKHWSLSVILSGLDSGIELVRRRSPPKASLNTSDNVAIAALEFSPLPPPEIERVLLDLPAGVEAFFEIPLSSNLEPYLNALRHTGAAAKIRTGGITADAFPSVPQLSQCIFSFAAAQVGFKATAGLHHPLPAEYPLTSEPGSPATLMHGFLNVAILAALAYWQKVTPEEALEVLQEISSKAFQFKEDSICWRDRCLDILEIEAARHFFRSFGSCSFQEPVNDLKHILDLRFEI
jgi:hypothetical protein